MGTFKLQLCLILIIGILSGEIFCYSETYYRKPRSTRTPQEESEGQGFAAAANYQFQYSVAEDGGNDFGHEEERNGQVTRGMYKVLLPDGRYQVVTYTADENGYRAEVTYENAGGGSGSGGYTAPVQPAEPLKPSGSYGPPPKDSAISPSTQSRSYAAPTSGSAGSFGRRNSFVKLRRNINGQNHNYHYNF